MKSVIIGGFEMDRVKKGQSTLEYVIILAVVLAAIITAVVAAGPSANLIEPFTQIPPAAQK